MSKQSTSALQLIANIISKYLGCFHSVCIAYDNYPATFTRQTPLVLEAAFPKTGFGTDHPPKALFITSAYKETQRRQTRSCKSS